MGSFNRKRADNASDSQSRKRTQPEDLLCPAVAKDRAWFCDDYRPISSFITHPLGAEHGAVIGIGTVRLPVKISPDPGNREHGIVTLRNVLHAPRSLCNMIGLPFHRDYSLIIAPRLPVNEFCLPDGTPAGFFKNERFIQLRLSGPPIGPHVGLSPLTSRCKYWLRGDWPDAERDKWLLPKKRQVLDRPSAEERKWLKKHYGNEYKFLAAHGLRIRDERDRQEGLEIMRAMMIPRDAVDSVGGMGYMRERVMPEERKWLKKHYGNEFKFLSIHGLMIHDEEDRQKGLRIIRAMMEKDRLYA